MKKLKIDVSDSIEFYGLAITSPLKDYQLCYQINKSFGFDLDKRATINLYVPKTKTSLNFAGYIYEDSDNRTSYFVAKNKEETQFLLPRLKQIDFVFFAKGAIAGQNILNCKEKLAGIKEIQNVLILENDHLKNISLEQCSKLTSTEPR